METYFGADMPKLGFGLMRLPQKDGVIDIEQVKEMVDLFLAAGFRYFDTAWGYNNGDSERAAGEALVKRYPRDSYWLATKLPAWVAKSKEEAHKMLYDSLERTGAGYFDSYLLHNLGGTRTETFDKYGIWEYLAAKKEEGLIRHLGFSMHADAESLDKVLTEHPEAEFVQLQINYVDWDSNGVQSRLCYETARRHGKGVVIMEPVKGGLLNSLPATAAEPLKAMHPEASLASWALRYAASLEGLVTVLSGMSTIEQMKDNLAVFKDFKPLTEAERGAIAEALARMNAIPTIPCTGCSYCVKGCPQNISIPDCFTALNTYTIYQDMRAAGMSYRFPIMLNGKAHANECIECGQCESVCPQGIDIINQLKAAVELFES